MGILTAHHANGTHGDRAVPAPGGATHEASEVWLLCGTVGSGRPKLALHFPPGHGLTEVATLHPRLRLSGGCGPICCSSPAHLTHSDGVESRALKWAVPVSALWDSEASPCHPPSPGSGLSGQTGLLGQLGCLPCEQRPSPVPGASEDHSLPACPQALLYRHSERGISCPHPWSRGASLSCLLLLPVMVCGPNSQLGPKVSPSPARAAAADLLPEPGSGTSSTCWSRGLGQVPPNPPGPGQGTAAKLRAGLNRRWAVWLCSLPICEGYRGQLVSFNAEKPTCPPAGGLGGTPRQGKSTCQEQGDREGPRHLWEPCGEICHLGPRSTLSWAMLSMVAWGEVGFPGQSYPKCIPSVSWFTTHVNPLGSSSAHFPVGPDSRQAGSQPAEPTLPHLAGVGMSHHVRATGTLGPALY